MLIRAERAKSNLNSDLEKAKRLAPHSKELAELEAAAKKANRPKSLLPYRLLLEEYKISVFAQELGTGQKVSAKRLETLAAELRKEIS
jgi:ATP-dependent helicase HrpA